MMIAQGRPPNWVHRETGLAVRVDDRVTELPGELAAIMTGPGGTALSDEPAVDLAWLETKLRRVMVEAQARYDATGRAIRDLRVDLAAVRQVPGLRRLVERRRLESRLRLAATDHAELGDLVAGAAARVHALRMFVIALAVPDGLLAELAAGWQVKPDRPAFVTEFDSEDSFLAADPRRGVRADWGATVLDGETYGDGWRRDPDDDPFSGDNGPELFGPWQLRFLERTGEVYATRRSARHPPRVWLLGRDLHDAETAHAVLDRVQEVIHRPNSLLTAAHVVHRTQLTTARSAPRLPDGTTGDTAGPETRGEIP